jgi:glutamate 5-kinase
MPSTALRQSVLAAARHLVVKLGTQLLTGPDGQLDPAFFKQIAAQTLTLRVRGVRTTIVSSGAIGAGMAELGLKKRPADIADLQAVAAVGQRRLMTHFHQAFSPHNVHVAQLLLTRSDFDDRARFLNIRNCVARLHELGCVPIINENDTVAVDELRFGDNDMLAALMCNALRANALVLLTVVDGLLDDAGQRIDLVGDLGAAADYARDDKSDLGTGGMTSKLAAAALVVEAGEITVVANGREPNILPRLLDPATRNLGTVFAPTKRHGKLDSRQRWIGLTKRPGGALAIDAGAVAALRDRGKSLLPSGITGVTGDFDQGQVLLVKDPAGREIARGLCNYSAAELRRIMGHKSAEIAKLLGRPSYAEVIHRDNLVLTGC